LADNAVIAQGCNAAKYQLLIFEQLVGVKLFEFANNFNHSQIKRRITMMTKRKSKRWAKFKVLLVLPLLSFLVLTFADSNTTKDPDKAKQKDADNALITQGDAKDSTQSKDQKKAEDEKKKKELTKKWAIEEAKKIEMSINKLKEKYKATDDPEMRKKIKAKVADLGKQMMKLKEGQKVQTTTRVRPVEGQKVVKGKILDGELLELEKLDREYKATDDPKLKEKIKEKMTQLKWNIENEKKIEMTIMELEQKYKATDDPELKKKIKEKLSVLKKELQKKKK
jgi:hypothetical protein